MKIEKIFAIIKQAFDRKIKHPSIKQIAMGCKPDPFSFRINILAYSNGNTIVEATYMGCHSFGGRKLMLLKGHWNVFESLDPHFINDEYPVVARFAPTSEGWKMAYECAKIL